MSSPPPSPLLTEIFVRKTQASNRSNDGSMGSGSPQPSPLRNEAKETSLPPSSPPLMEMILQKPQAYDYSNDGSTASGSPLRNEVNEPSPPPPSPPLTEMAFQNRRAYDNSNFGNTATSSPEQSSLGKDAKDPSPPTSSPPPTEMVSPKPKAYDYFKVGTRATESSRRSLKEAKDPSPMPPSPPLVELNFQKPQRSDHQDLDDEATISSPPPRFYDAEQSIPQPSADGAPRISSSDRSSPDYSDTENFSVSSLQQSPAPLSSPPRAGMSLPIPNSTKRNKEQLASPNLSPLRLIKGTTFLPPVPPLPRPPNNTPEKPMSPGMPVHVAAVAVASRLSREDPAVVAKVVDGDGAGVTGVADGTGRGGWPAVRGYASAPSGVDRGDERVAELGLRVGALVLSLIAFSVMAGDKTNGWAGDSFDRYEEYRFLVSVNVIVFVYSGFQVYTRFHPMIAKRQILPPRIRLYFDLLMDQILSYLLMSASSAAASRNDIWVTRFNSDKFTHGIDSSVAMSFLAFMALASSSIVSAYNLFKLC